MFSLAARQLSGRSYLPALAALVVTLAVLGVVLGAPTGAWAATAPAGPVIDTTQSFTVSAWVNLNNTNGYQTFVTHDRSQVSGFYLQLRGDSHRFAFAHLAHGSISALGTIATAGGVIPQPGEWYLLTGVYDATKKKISLYVNGALEDTESSSGRWAGNGRLAVGRSKFAGNPVDSVSGRVDDVQAHSGVLGASAIKRLAGPGRLIVNASQAGPRINPTEFGEFLEEVNHSGDGGVYAELIRNRDLKEDAGSPAYWSAVTGGGASGSIALDTTQGPTSANAVSLELSVGSVPAGGRVGVANAGYFGIPVTPSTAYHVSFYARSSQPSTGPLTVDLETNGGQVYASSTIPGVTSSWALYTTTLTVPKGVARSTSNRFVISTSDASAAGSTLWFDIVSLFPPTYHGVSGGLRADLMDKLGALHPGYLRVPGGNYLEGATIDTRFEWSSTVGPIEDRPGHFDSAWGYWSDDGMGLLEYLEMAEDVGARPLLAVWAGYALNGTVMPQDQLGAYVTDAVNEIHYATDPVSTSWGAMRAADGHPQPFHLLGVEVGNEDFFDSSGSYNAYRYPMFYDAIKAAFPGMAVVATTPVTSRRMDMLDEHFYNTDPQYFAANAHLFDSASRSGPKVIVGEYAAIAGQPTGTLADAIGEAAFLTGLERNADLVVGASYAPLLANVNAPSWSTNLIGYNALKSFGSPSYWMQDMLSAGHGDHVIGSQVVAGAGTLFQVASQSPGHTYVVVVNDGGTAAPMTVSLSGLPGGVRGGTATTLTGGPTAMNSLAHPTAVAPKVTTLSARGTSFKYTFPANSVVVLDLSTSAGVSAAGSSLARDADGEVSGLGRRAGRPG